jgi:hypothetical protein
VSARGASRTGKNKMNPYPPNPTAHPPLMSSQLPHPRATIRSPRKPNHCLSLTSDQYNVWTPRLCGLMVRRWHLIGHFPILYHPTPDESTR